MNIRIRKFLLLHQKKNVDHEENKVILLRRKNNSNFQKMFLKIYSE